MEKPERVGEQTEQEPMLGTTIMAIAFKDGVVLGADTRTSMGTYISSRVSRKITKIGDKVYVCRSGSAADTQAVSDILRYRIDESLHCYNEELTIENIATIAKKIIYKNSHLLAGLIVAGVDKRGGDIFSISLGGTIVKQKCAVAGSGSVYIVGMCDREYREDMSREEAISFVKNAIAHAIHRDNSSGGCARLFVITKEGEEEIFVPGNELDL